ncbi:MAG: LysR substrate-binding domain-containing protein [Pseudomonadota bacterium]
MKMFSKARNIRLRQLRCFVTVARRRSFVLAAEELGLTQPAVSRSVRELEQIIGHELFDRSQRGAQLTNRGRTLLDAAEMGLLQIAQGVSAATGDVSPTDPIRLGALPNVCSQFLPDIVHGFKLDYPHVTVTILPGTNANLLDGLRLGETDLVLGRLSSTDDMRGLVFETIFDEPLIFVVRRNHPLASSTAQLEDTLSFPYVVPPRGTIIRQEMDRFLASRGITDLPNVIETTSSDFQRSYVLKTDAICVIPRGVFMTDLTAGEIVSLEIGEAELTGPVGLTTNPELPVSAPMVDLLERIRNNYKIPKMV